MDKTEDNILLDITYINSTQEDNIQMKVVEVVFGGVKGK